ncbi:MAG: LysM peptidoglycan-binding domain-containing protein [Flavobacterium sp.]|uniref:LysM peptidoglycan-binding domain-containing protein n=1 Tax=Flavobacterium sp. TaxID=239 RepID=UPI00260EB7C0|nr:LysM peptidoglycan-binding domain-containing protein [Flavobacterium sp.]MDD5148928.1 LysM peptidoglycan-binding domain-containing protein [Flavobacterium sp.]
MIKKNTILSIFLLLSAQLFSQQVATKETRLSYLDSVKNSFTKYDVAARVDSLWLNELTNLDLYNDLSGDIKTINVDEKVDYELSTDLLKARLKAMDAKSPFHIEYNQGLENIIKSFLKNRKKSFERLMGISEYYFPMFEEALAKKNVPLEIKYLAVVESALNPKAVSRVGATGLWQFMYQTGKLYNLNIDSYVDDRSDPLKASEAAAQYMANMYAIFGDWELVLASYNSGPGNVTKAIRRSGGQQNFWNIKKFLPKETQSYVPAFLATMYIFEYHNEHGIHPERAIVNHFATDTIMIKKQMSFKQISDLIDVPVAQLQLLNPSYKMNEVPFYENQNHFLRLPKDKIAIFTSNEDRIYAYVQHEMDLREKPFQVTKAIAINDTINYTTQRVTVPKTKYYTVRRGDNLGGIADKYDVSLVDLKKWNKLKGNTISYGKSLKIIASESVVRTIKKEPKTNKIPLEIAPDNQKLASTEAKTAKAELAKKSIKIDTLSTNSTYYVVQKGDNLGNIAKKLNVTVDEIKQWNNLSDANIKLGASLQVANIDTESQEIAPTSKFENVEYVVKKGDNLGNISKKFGSSIDDIKLWNNLQNPNISLGSTLIVAKNEIPIASKTAEKTFKKKESLASVSKKNATDYYVKKGDSLYSIAKKYPGVSISDIKKWNDIREGELKPGMKLKING